MALSLDKDLSEFVRSPVSSDWTHSWHLKAHTVCYSRCIVKLPVISSSRCIRWFFFAPSLSHCLNYFWDAILREKFDELKVRKKRQEQETRGAKKKKSLCWLMDELVQREGERKKERRVWEGSRLLIKHWGSSVSCPETEWISSQNRIELITNDEGFSFEGAPDTHTWYRVYQHHLHSASHFLNGCGGDT